jgi:hypothetical protein
LYSIYEKTKEMTNQKFKELIQKATQNSVDTLTKKNADYADASTDALSNFKESAVFAGVTPVQSCMVLIGTKLSRLRNLMLNDKKPRNEAIEDTILDMRNYLIILEALIQDSKDN